MGSGGGASHSDVQVGLLPSPDPELYALGQII